MRREIHEMHEKALSKVARLLRPEFVWEEGKRFYYDPSHKRRFYEVDCVTVDGKIALEYEGPNHYCDVWKGVRDDNRADYFDRSGFDFKRWPYYCQLTREVAQHFFGDVEETAYQKCLHEVYKSNSVSKILACGFHSTKNIPANFTHLGVDRFINELEILPTIVKDQVVESLRLYCRDENSLEFVLGRDQRLHGLLLHISDPENLKAHFKRN